MGRVESAAHGLVDCHSHFYPAWYLDLLRARHAAPRVVAHDGQEYFQAFPVVPPPAGRPAGQPLTSAFWEPGEKLAFMDAHGIDLTLVSVGNPWADVESGAASTALARRLNEALASLAGDADGRLLALGVLPSAPVTDGVAVARTLAEDPRFVGVAVGPTLDGRPLDDPELTPLWAALAEADLTVLVHPAYGCSDLAIFTGHGHVLPLAVGFLVESATTAIRLALSGVLEETGLRVVLPHAGGVLPVVAERVAAVTPPGGRGSPAALSGVFVDSIAAGEGAWAAAVAAVGEERIVFGSDHPFLVGGPEPLAAATARLSATQARAATLKAFPRLHDAGVEV